MVKFQWLEFDLILISMILSYLWSSEQHQVKLEMFRPATLIFLASLVSVVTSSRGPLVMIGGGLEEDNEAVWGRMMEEAGGEGVSVWVVE